IRVETVYQEIDILPEGFTVNPERVKPYGTAHAILMAKDAIKEPFAVINADDYYGKHSYQVLSQYLQNAPENQYAMVAFALGNTLSAHGTVSRGVCVVDEENNLQQIQEYTEIQKLNDTIVCGNKEFPFKTPVSLNFWGFTPAIFPWFQEAFIEYLTNPTKNEFQLPDVIHQGIQKNKFSIKVLSSKEQWLGMTYIQDKEWVQNYLKNEENYERI
ncbi:MAG TPA: nucleotidyltransferase, partial [Planctomycetota bacterium]|nr:nucleotidyltransferase [Planctomycetota bacterium]